uniref:Uncharacterized protein n=1 Tax=Trichuris muris TaxID=70415 RepID=A0A5S6R170_TRIMR
MRETDERLAVMLHVSVKESLREEIKQFWELGSIGMKYKELQEDKPQVFVERLKDMAQTTENRLKNEKLKQTRESALPKASSFGSQRLPLFKPPLPDCGQREKKVLPTCVPVTNLNGYTFEKQTHFFTFTTRLAIALADSLYTTWKLLNALMAVSLKQHNITVTYS